MERGVSFPACVGLGSACRLEFDLEGLGPVEGGASWQQAVVRGAFNSEHGWYSGNSLHLYFQQEEVAEIRTGTCRMKDLRCRLKDSPRHRRGESFSLMPIDY